MNKKDFCNATIKDVTVIFRHGGGHMHFFVVPYLIDEDTALMLQMEMGYHPSGYGFYAFDPTISQTTWKCRDSCD